MKVPRPTGGSRQSNGVGKIFVKFDTPESAGKALRALAGRKFADRTVVTTYFSEVSRSRNCSKIVIDNFHRKTSRSRPGNGSTLNAKLRQSPRLKVRFNSTTLLLTSNTAVFRAPISLYF
jgi:hypothetical protein